MSANGWYSSIRVFDDEQVASSSARAVMSVPIKAAVAAEKICSSGSALYKPAISKAGLTVDASRAVIVGTETTTASR